MGIINKVGGFFGLGGEENTEADVAVESTPVETSAPKKSKVVNMGASASQMKVVILQPATYSEAQLIVDHLKSRKPVVVNLEKISSEVAVKVINFLSGAVYALDGSMQKVAAGIILITPHNVSIMSEYGEALKTVAYDEADV